MPFRSNRRKLLTAAGAVGGSVLAGCLSSVSGLDGRDVDDGDVGGTGRTLKLGVMQPLSGNLGSVGEPIRDAALLPIEQVRDDVDLEFDYKVVDTETSPAAGVQGAVDLVDEGYPMVTGPAASDVTLQVTQQVLIPYRVVSCSPASTSPTITLLNDAGLVYRTAISDSLQGIVLADLAATDRGHETAATLYINNDYGWQLSQAFSRAFQNTHGGTVSAQVPLDEGKESYAAELERARADDPDLLLLIGYPESGAKMFDDLGDDIDDVDVFVTDGLQDGSLHEATSTPINGVRGVAAANAGPREEDFVALYEEEYGSSPGIFTAHAYDATAVLLLANAFAGQNEGTAIRNAIQAVTFGPGEVIYPNSLDKGLKLAAAGENVEYRGASSPVVFDEYGDVRDATFEYWKFDDSADGGISEIDRYNV